MVKRPPLRLTRLPQLAALTQRPYSRTEDSQVSKGRSVTLSPDLETWDRAKLAEWQIARLGELLATLVPANRFWTRKFAEAGVDPSSIHTADDLRRIPFTTKEELVEDQLAHPPYGSNLTFPLKDYSRL